MTNERCAFTNVPFFIGLFGVVLLIVLVILSKKGILSTSEGLALIFGPVVISLAIFLVFVALIDILNSPDMYSSNKIMWILFCGVFGTVGTIAYFDIKFRGAFYYKASVAFYNKIRKILSAYHEQNNENRMEKSPEKYSGDYVKSDVQEDIENDFENDFETPDKKTKTANTLGVLVALIITGGILSLHLAFYISIVYPCGGITDPCCEGKFCSKDYLACGSDGMCHLCGTINNPCCEGNTCLSPYSICGADGICRMDKKAISDLVDKLLNKS